MAAARWREITDTRLAAERSATYNYAAENKEITKRVARNMPDVRIGAKTVHGFFKRSIYATLYIYSGHIVGRDRIRL